MPPSEWLVVRQQFPATETTAYFDSAGAALVPRAAQVAMAAYYAGVPYNTRLDLGAAASYGAVGEDADLVTARVTEARAAVARVVGSTAADVAFTKNATEALNLLALGLPFESGDEVLVSEMAHQSGLLPWIRLAADRGVRVIRIPTDACGRLDPEEVERRLTPRTALVLLIAVSSLLGTTEPVEAVGEIAARHRVPLAVDAAQAVGRIPIDMARWRCEFLVFSGHKGLLGPHGIAAIVGRNGSLERVRPILVGSRSALVRDLPEGGITYDLAGMPFHLEGGAVNTGGAIGLGASIQFLESVGWPAVHGRIAQLADTAWQAIASVPDVILYGDPNHFVRTGIISFNIPGLESRQVCEALWRFDRLVASPGMHGAPLASKKLSTSGTVRVSFHCYNAEEEIERLARALHRVASHSHPESR